MSTSEAFAIRYANISRPQTAWQQVPEGFHSAGTEFKSKRNCLMRRLALDTGTDEVDVTSAENGDDDKQTPQGG